ncbi:MAG: hypothetical protein L0216_00365 [Planctomycetales bacterium]|nr:hypothetical protein [Planctomycetales bacterium]
MGAATDPDVERIVLALVYQVEALVDVLADAKLLDREALRRRVGELVSQAATPAVKGPEKAR